MFEVIKSWYARHFTDPQTVLVLLVFGSFITFFYFFGHILTPVIIGVVFAYILERPVTAFEFYLGRTASVLLVFSVFVGSLLFLLIWVLPLLWSQLASLFNSAPGEFGKWHTSLQALYQDYPDFFNQEQLSQLTLWARDYASFLAKSLFSFTIASIPNLIIVSMYLFLIPLLIFYFLNDKEKIINWFKSFLPSNRGLFSKILKAAHLKLGSFVRCKFVEVIVVASVCYFGFIVLGVDYAALLAALVGLSVLIPYLGALLATIPVVVAASLQFGFSYDTVSVLLFYLILQFVDGNILAPLLSSEAVNIHPVAIIISFLFFGGTIGFWGLLFAVPFAILIQVVIELWPSKTKTS